MPIRDRAKRLLRELARRLRRPPKPQPDPPGDPHADKLAPVRRGPKGRSGAAVAEPEEEINTNVRARR